VYTFFTISLPGQSDVVLSDGGVEKIAMVVNSGSYDRVSYALSIAKVALALGMDVHAIFTYGGLTRLIRGRTDELGAVPNETVRSRLAAGIAKGTVTNLSADLKEAKKLGFRIYACVSAMGILNVTQDELIPEVDQVMGLAAFLDLARGAQTYYI
jgi:peroxiredoxin family protein